MPLPRAYPGVHLSPKPQPKRTDSPSPSSGVGRLGPSDGPLRSHAGAVGSTEEVLPAAGCVCVGGEPLIRSFCARPASHMSFRRKQAQRSLDSVLADPPIHPRNGPLGPASKKPLYPNAPDLPLPLACAPWASPGRYLFLLPVGEFSRGTWPHLTSPIDTRKMNLFLSLPWTPAFGVQE